MNAGTYLGEFTSVTTWVESVRLADGTRVRRDHAACGFRYRASDLPPSEIVVRAALDLRPRPRADIEADVRSLRQRRAQREPRKVASNGSTFKNPPGQFAGRLIESAGCKGWREGPAVCSPVHANWLVNVGASTTRGQIDLHDAQHTIDAVDLTRAERWISVPSANSIQYLQFTTPLEEEPTNRCGKEVLSDIHVSTGDDSAAGISFPDGCTTVGLTAQEKVLAFMIFDISSCVGPPIGKPSH